MAQITQRNIIEKTVRERLQEILTKDCKNEGENGINVDGFETVFFSGKSISSVRYTVGKRFYVPDWTKIYIGTGRSIPLEEMVNRLYFYNKVLLLGGR